MANLTTKYALLGHETVQIEEQSGWFIVNVPLLHEEFTTSSASLF